MGTASWNIPLTSARHCRPCSQVSWEWKILRKTALFMVSDFPLSKIFLLREKKWLKYMNTYKNCFWLKKKSEARVLSSNIQSSSRWDSLPMPSALWALLGISDFHSQPDSSFAYKTQPQLYRTFKLGKTGKVPSSTKDGEREAPRRKNWLWSRFLIQLALVSLWVPEKMIHILQLL